MIQTAIEFLEFELSKSHLTTEEIVKIFNKAKEMEKQQILLAFDIGDVDGEKLSAEEYFNETYNEQ